MGEACVSTDDTMANKEFHGKSFEVRNVDMMEKGPHGYKEDHCSGAHLVCSTL